jgi:3-isopropylmalate/(R)-2-methylmalate dehydratase small subunit
MIIEARVVRITGDNIDTDVLYPGPFLNIEEPDLMKHHLFEGLDPALRERLGGDTALVVDSNFGSGSSREHVPRAMKASGVRCVIGRSFARIFYRNCINLGLLAIAAPKLVDCVEDDASLKLDLAARFATIGNSTIELSGLHPFILEAITAGGFVEWAREHPPLSHEEAAS